MKTQITAWPGYVLGLAIIIGAAIACASISKPNDQRVLVQNKTTLVFMVNGTNCIYPGQSKVVGTTNDIVHIEATGTVRSGTTTNVWLGVELNKKLAPNATKVEITLDDFP